MTDKIYTYKDIAKIFDCHEKTIYRKIKKVRETYPDNKSINNYMGSKWYCFEGDLKDLSIVELVQMLNLNKKSGILHITGPGDGEIYLQGGQLIGAKTKKNSGEEAVYELVTFDKGSFKFEVTEKGLDNNISNSTMNVIMEACRIMDEKKHEGK